MIGIIRQTDLIEILKEGPAHSVSDLASRFANKDDLTPYEWASLKARVGSKLRALEKSGYVRRMGMGTRTRWVLYSYKEGENGTIEVR